jgi:hypothetical protein
MARTSKAMAMTDLGFRLGAFELRPGERRRGSGWGLLGLHNDGSLTCTHDFGAAKIVRTRKRNPEKPERAAL